MPADLGQRGARNGGVPLRNAGSRRVAFGGRRSIHRQGSSPDVAIGLDGTELEFPLDRQLIKQLSYLTHQGDTMFIVLAIILGLGWVLGLTVMKVSSFAIHILLVVAVVSLVLHFVRGSRST